MEHSLILIVFLLCAFLTSATLSGMLIPRILSRSLKKGHLDKPNYRKMHSGYASRLGGLSFLPEMLFSVALVIGIYIFTDASDFFCFQGFSLFSGGFLFLSAAFVYFTGVVDDLKGLNYRIKLIALSLTGISCYCSGLRMPSLAGLLGIGQLPQMVNALAVVFLVVAVIVAINLIDGIDGLASGLSSLAFIYYGTLFIKYGAYSYALGVFALLGVIVPFFFYNTYNKSTKHRIFMGDTGSMTLGLSLVVCALLVNSLNPQSEDLNLVKAFVPLMVPCLDAFRVFVYRFAHHLSPFHPDKNHLHHKLCAMYNSQNTARRIILLVAIVYAAANILLMTYTDININILLAIDVLLYFAWNIILSKRLKRKK